MHIAWNWQLIWFLKCFETFFKSFLKSHLNFWVRVIHESFLLLSIWNKGLFFYQQPMWIVKYICSVFKTFRPSLLCVSLVSVCGVKRQCVQEIWQKQFISSFLQWCSRTFPSVFSTLHCCSADHEGIWLERR